MAGTACPEANGLETTCDSIGKLPCPGVPPRSECTEEATAKHEGDGFAKGEVDVGRFGSSWQTAKGDLALEVTGAECCKDRWKA